MIEASQVKYTKIEIFEIRYKCNASLGMGVF